MIPIPDPVYSKSAWDRIPPSSSKENCAKMLETVCIQIISAFTH